MPELTEYTIEPLAVVVAGVTVALTVPNNFAGVATVPATLSVPLKQSKGILIVNAIAVLFSYVQGITSA